MIRRNPLTSLMGRFFSLKMSRRSCSSRASSGLLSLNWTCRPGRGDREARGGAEQAGEVWGGPMRCGAGRGAHVRRGGEGRSHVLGEGRTRPSRCLTLSNPYTPQS